ncbi:MAG: hypothetical protein WBM54_12215, partial [Woeseia sp.]
MPVHAGVGPEPVLPKTHQALIPLVNVATAKGWQNGTQPIAAAGLEVNVFANGLDHPRWLYVL